MYATMMDETSDLSAKERFQPLVRQSSCPCCCPNIYESPFEFHLPSCWAFLWHFVCRCNFCLKPSTPTQQELDRLFPVLHQPVVLLPQSESASRGVSVTWLGHACCLFTFPETGHRVLFDPVFSQRCSPVTFAGPLRYRQPPCGLAQLPPLDAVCISHNHYDHLDSETLRQLAELQPQVLFCVPVGDGRLMAGLGCRRVLEMNWWEAVRLQPKGDVHSANPGAGLSVTFTPSKHWSARGVLDRNRSLWGSYVMQPDAGSGSRCCYFGGDTGYDDRLFKQIRSQFGPMRLSAIPIGAYLPRHLLGSQHVSPREAVWIHKDLESAKTLGIHWGTFDMGSTEAAMDPPKDLAQERRDQNIPEDGFVSVFIGETVFAD